MLLKILTNFFLDALENTSDTFTILTNFPL